MALKIDYENVRARAQDIDDVIQILNAQKATLQTTSDNLDNVWQGTAANTFKKKVEEFISSLETTIKQMSELKKSIISIADDIKKTDEELASQLSANNTSNGIRTQMLNGNAPRAKITLGGLQLK